LSVARRRPAPIDPDVPALDPAELPETVAEGGNKGLSLAITLGKAHHPDPTHTNRLRACRERPRDSCKTQYRDELTPSHTHLSSGRSIVSAETSALKEAETGFAIATYELAHVRFGSKANMCSAIGHVRFTPNSDRESGHGN